MTTTHTDRDAAGNAIGKTPREEAFDYLDARLIAEWASGVRGETMWFAYDGSLSLELEPAVLGPVRTSRDVRQRHPMTDVKVSFGTGGEATLEFPTERSDALIWGEGAVEKFLFPYYASVFAWQAADFLRKVERAWYEYSADAVQVVALLHTCGPRPQTGVVTAEDTLHVLFAPVEDDGGLGTPQILTLEKFLERPWFGPERGQPLTIEGGGGPLGHVGLTAAGYLTSIPARELAEVAGGVRGQYLYLAREGDRLVMYACPGSERCPADAGNPVLFTRLRRPDRPAPTSMEVKVNGAWQPLMGSEESFRKSPPDSLFWTDAAVEKLMVPYYASVKGRHAPIAISLLQGTWNAVILPDAPQTAQEAIVALQDIVDEPSTQETEVFGLVHLPRSEWVPETTEQTADVVSGRGRARGEGATRTPSLALEDRTLVLRYHEGRVIPQPVGRGGR